MIFLCSSISHVAHDIPRHLNTPAKKMRMLFVDTAPEVEKGDKSWLRADRKSLVDAGFQVENYTLTGKTKAEVKKKVESVDIIYVSGGATLYLLEKIKRTGFDKVVRAQVKKGIPYIGSSAGALVTSPNLSSIKNWFSWDKGEGLKDYNGIGLVNFIPMPHWGSSFFKKSYLDSGLAGAYNTNYCLVLLTDYQYIRVEGPKHQIFEVRH